MRGATGNVVSVASDLLDGPALRSDVVSIVGRRRGGCWDYWRCSVDRAMGWKSATRRGRGRGWIDSVRPDGSWVQRTNSQAVRVDDAIAENGFDVGLSRESMKGRGVVFLWCRLDCSDAKVFITMDEAGSGGRNPGLGVGGNRRVAIEDKEAMGSTNGGGIDLSVSIACKERQENDEPRA